ncbi:MAG: hypothetical protein AB7U75_10120 [Hyphomicrobiaceae bacterium]
MHYLGNERFGMWMTTSSLIALLSFADLGIGNGLLSSVATAHGRDDREQIRTLVSSAYSALSSIALTLLLLLALAYPFVPWHALFNVQSELARAEAGPALAILVSCFALAIPIGVVQRTQVALQMGYTASLWQCAASLLGLGGVLLAIRFNASLPVLLLAYAGAPLLIGLINSLVFFLWRRRDLVPSASRISRCAMGSLTRTGLLFLVLQVAASVTFMSDNFIIAQKLGAAAVAEYAVPEKLFALVGMVIWLALSPLWPAYGEAIARGDGDWVRKTLRRSIILSASVAAVGSSVLLVAAPWMLHIWVGHAVAPPFLLLLGFSVWKVIEAVGQALAMFLNGARVVGLQVVVGLLTAIVAIAMKIYLVGEIGVAGAVWATIVSYCVLALAPYYLLWSRVVHPTSTATT